MKRLLLVPCLFGALTVLAQPAGADAALRSDLDRLTALYTDGFGSLDPGSRHVVLGPLFKPDSRDAVAFFTLSGVDLMNGYEQYIAIFAQGQGRSTPVAKERPYRMVASAQIGTRWARTLDWKTAKISPGQVVVHGMRWGSRDAGCCPTQPIEVTFSIAPAAGGETLYPLLRQSERPARSR